MNQGRKTKRTKRRSSGKLPDFSSMTDAEVAEFWDTHDSADYWDQLEQIDEPVLIATSPKKAISIRLPEAMTVKLKQIARKKGIGYQPLIRMWLLERLVQELQEEPKSKK